MQEYERGEDLLENLNADILLLDIKMDGLDGIEIKNILQHQKSRTGILFLSNYLEAIPEAFGRQVYGFLKKPVRKIKMKPLDFRVKRITRPYYWYAWLLWNCISMLFFWAALGEDPKWMVVLLIVHILYLTLLTVKRFHDAGYGTGYALFCIVLTLMGIGYPLIVRVAIKPSDLDNQWGPNEERLKFEENKDFYAR